MRRHACCSSVFTTWSCSTWVFVFICVHMCGKNHGVHNYSGAHLYFLVHTYIASIALVLSKQSTAIGYLSVLRLNRCDMPPACMHQINCHSAGTVSDGAASPLQAVPSSMHAGTIASLSLAGPAVIEFRRTGESHALLLPPRSLLVMAGPARYCWQHYIPHRKADQVQGTLLPRATCRMSFTFRQVASQHCS